MISEMMQVSLGESMEGVTERALAIASETGRPQRFEFNGNLFEAQPDKPGMGTILMIGGKAWRYSDDGLRREEANAPMPRYPTPEEELILFIGNRTKAMPKEWEFNDIFLAIAQQKQILIAAQNRPWLANIHRDIYQRAGDQAFSSASPRTLRVRNGATVYFEVLNPVSWETFAGMRFDVAFLEDNQKEAMAGNYNKFPYRVTNRERERYLEAESRKMQREDRAAEFARIEKEREQWRQEKIAEERKNEQPAMLRWSRQSGDPETLPDMRPGMIVPGNVTLDSMQESYAKSFVTSVQSYNFRFTGFSSQPATAEDRLAIVRGVLLRHLKVQLQRAPSMAAVYSNDAEGGVVTAADIQRVVDALEVGATPSPFWGEGINIGVDLSATAEDGTKVVLSGEKRFESGVIFDPSNKPIRKFRLTEETA